MSRLCRRHARDAELPRKLTSRPACACGRCGVPGRGGRPPRPRSPLSAWCFSESPNTRPRPRLPWDGAIVPVFRDVRPLLCFSHRHHETGRPDISEQEPRRPLRGQVPPLHPVRGRRRQRQHLVRGRLSGLAPWRLTVSPGWHGRPPLLHLPSGLEDAGIPVHPLPPPRGAESWRGPNDR